MTASIEGAALAPAAWPTNLKRSRALESNPRVGEIALRQRWVGELRDTVVAANLPVVKIAMK